MRFPVLRVVALGILVAALTMALAPVALASGHLQAADGQSLNDQPTDVQALYRSVYGAGAAARWVEDHNAAIGEMGMDAPPSAAMTDVYLTVRHVAWQRSGDAELAARIAADVMARGTAEAFLAGTDTGVVWGVWTEPEPMGMGSRGNGGSSSSTSSGPSAPASPSTSSVVTWSNTSKHYEVGQSMSLTLPSAPGAASYTLTAIPDTLAGLSADVSSESPITISGRPRVVTAAGVVLTYAALDADGEALLNQLDVAFTLTVTIHIRDADLEPFFTDSAKKALKSAKITEGDSLVADAVVLPLATGGNGDLDYDLKGAPTGFTTAVPEGANPTAGSVTGGSTAEVGTYTLTYTARDDDKDTASLTFTITVEKDVEPTAPNIGDMEFTAGDSVAVLLPAGSGGNGVLTYAISNAPGDLELSSQRYLHGTLADDLPDSVTIVTYTVTDGDTSGDADSDTFVIRIKAKA